MRGRNNNNNNSNSSNRKGPNPLTRSYESNGPDVKIRGSAQQIAEKYATLARDAHSAGDRVMAENYLQHAEHYNRIIMAAQGAMPAPAPRDQRDEFDEEDGDESGDQPYANQPQDARQPEARQNDGRQGENRDGRQQDGRQNESRQNESRQGEGRDGRQQESRQNENRDGRQRDNRREDGRREDGRREDGRREEGRREDTRRDGENPPREHRRDQQPQPVAAREAAPASESRPNDGSGPQPVIEGMPAEVALEQEAMAGQKAAGRRRGRPPRADGIAKSPEDVVAAEPSAAAPEPVAGQAPVAAGDDAAPRRPRRPRRSRNRDEGEQAAEDNTDEPAIAAQ
jgi:hypothetical protein